MFEYPVIFGDYYDDGHGKYETFFVSCNVDQDGLKKAYEAAVVTTGYRTATNEHDFMHKLERKSKALFNRYDQPYARGEADAVRDLIVNHGMDNRHHRNDEFELFNFTQPEQADEPHEYGGYFEEGVYDFAEWFFRFCKIGNKDLEWKWIDDEREPAIFNCHGYGFFD